MCNRFQVYALLALTVALVGAMWVVPGWGGLIFGALAGATLWAVMWRYTP